MALPFFGYVAEKKCQSLGRDIARLCEQLGPTFIKIGQILSSRPDIVSPEIASELARLQAQVEPFDTGLIPEIIQAEFGHAIEDVFRKFDMIPVSSASIAHVHRAVLHNGREVAVKVRRPKIEKTVASDFCLLEFGAAWLRHMPMLRVLPMLQAISEFRIAIEDQLDFRLEAQNNREFTKHFARQPHIRFPELIGELCTERVLTMEYFSDIHPMTQLATNHPAGGRLILERGLNALYRMIFTDGLIHGDLHPGNIFYRDNGEVVMLDLGLVAHLSKKERRDFSMFFLGMVMNQGKQCADVVFETAISYPPNFDRDAFDVTMIALIEEHSGKVASDFEVSSFVMQLFDIQRRMELTGSTRFMMTILALLMFEGIAKKVDPGLDFQGLSFRYVADAMMPMP